MAIVKVALRQKETLAVLRVRDKAILLQTMLWPDEVRKPEFAGLDADIELRPQELKMAASLIESMAADFEPTGFTDEYQSAVRELIDAKLEKGDAAELPADETKEAGRKGGEVIDLLTALQRSVDRARGGAAGGADDEGAGVPSAAKKAPGKAAPAKKSAAKAPAKKSAAKKSAAKPAAKSAPSKKAASKSA
jgi:DNA end-binding protein Ku